MQGKIFFVLIDAHSKWLEVCQILSTSSSETIQHLRTIFSRFGLPETLVSDNRPQFSSEEFKLFCQRSGIYHSLIAPITHHQMGWPNMQFRPLSRVLRNLKKALWSSDFVGYYLTIDLPLTVLLASRANAWQTSKVTSEAKFGVYRKQDYQKRAHHKTAANQNFQEGEAVYETILLQAPHGCMAR